MTDGLPTLVFDFPWLLLAGAALPLALTLLLAWHHRRRRARLQRFAEPSALVRLAGPGWVGERAVGWRLVLVAALAGIALAGPRWGLARGRATASGIDMVLALDASLSMLAEDERPSRLERMKQEVRRIRAQGRADRIALLAFAGRSYILTPLTSDDGALELFLDNLDPSIVGQAGSSLSRAIRQGTDLLLASDGSADRALVLMSDGEAFEPVEETVAAATEAGRKGVTLVTVGFGTQAGATIPIRDGSVVRPKRDADGAIVTTRYDPARLAAAAEAAGGTFIAAELTDKATRVRAALRSLRSARRAVDAREDHVPRFQWLLVPALLLLVVDTWRAARGPRRRPDAARRPMRTLHPATPAVLVAVLVPLLPMACALEPDPAVRFENGDVYGALGVYRAAVVGGDSTSRTRYNMGTVLLAADSLPGAAELLDAVRRGADGELRARSRFNAGLTRLRQGRAANGPERDHALALARAAYRAYLGERTDDLDAKWNYELALRPPPPSGGGGGGGGGKDPQPQAEGESPQDAPAGGLDRQQADALLNAAAREERDVQGRKPTGGRTPPAGKDW